MNKSRATELLAQWPHIDLKDGTGLTKDERAELWHIFNNNIDRFSMDLSFKSILEWVANGELEN